MSEYEETVTEEQQAIAAGPRVDFAQRRIWIAESMTVELVADVVRSLLVLEDASSEAITLWVTTPGGDAEAVMALLDVMANLEASVIVVGIGLVASAGAFLLIGADHRVVYPNTHVMLHGPGMGLSGSGTLTMGEMEEDLKHMVWLRDRMVKLVAECTGFSKEAAVSLLGDGQDHWFRGGDAAVELGLADVCLDPGENYAVSVS